jgi:transcriptional regulator with XRE-family HTH domain
VSISKISIRQIKAARSLLGWSQDDLAERSGVSKPTIGRLESQDSETIGGREETGMALIAALEKAGVEFIAENGGGVGVRMAKKARRSK